MNDEKRNSAKSSLHMGRHSMGRNMTIQKPKNMKPTLKRLWKYLSVHKFKLFFVFLFVILVTLSSLVTTRIIGIAIDKYIITKDFKGLMYISVILIVIYIIGTISNWLQIMISVNISQYTVSEIRKELFNKMQSLPLKFFDTRTHGEIMSRITNDVDNISNSLNTSLSQFISSILTIVGILAFMIILNPLLTLISLITIPLLIFITSQITKHSRKFFKSQQEVLGQLNGKIEEVISGQKVVKVFVKEKAEIEQFQELNESLKKVGVSAQIFSGIIGPASMFVNNLSYGLVSAIGGVMVIFNMINIGSLTSFLIFSRQFGRPFNELANQYNALLSAIAGAERVFEIIDQEPEPKDTNDAYILNNVKGEVIFENVNFSYEENNPILKNISLAAKPGQTIALVGPTGAGKTTIINLLTRFYDIQSGTITIDGHNIRNITRNSLRSSLGIVLQDTYLFSGTIIENIRYGRLDATDEEVKEAAILANAHGFIRRLSHGYNTELSEDGDTLSQGQKQMISIARAILADPSILILDEATSNVDTRTEIKIQEAMLNLMKGRTSFVIAHRLSTIRNADIIAVINDGQIIEKGNHEYLINQKGFYYNLYMNQFKN